MMLYQQLHVVHQLDNGEEFENPPGIEQALEVVRHACALADSNSTPPLYERVTRRLIGTKQIKLASITEESIRHIANQVQLFVNAGSPIELTTSTGAKKDKVSLPQDEQPDVAELMTLLTIKAIHHAIQEIYPPGIHLHISQEDRGDLYLFETMPEIEKHVRRYTEKFKELVDVLDTRGVITTSKESEEFQEVGIHTQEDFVKAAQVCENLFVDYLNESDQKEPASWESLPSYQRLVAAGWKGIITPELRTYNYQRSSLIHNHKISEREKSIKHLARMFAAVLLRKQKNIHGHTIEPIRISFAAPTPGMPTKHGRIFLRAVPRKISGSGIPYWCGEGVMAETVTKNMVSSYPRIQNRNEPLTAKTKRISGKMLIQSTGKTSIDAPLIKLQSL